jgi:hypothetical protein
LENSFGVRYELERNRGIGNDGWEFSGMVWLKNNLENIKNRLLVVGIVFCLLAAPGDGAFGWLIKFDYELGDFAYFLKEFVDGSLGLSSIQQGHWFLMAIGLGIWRTLRP